MEEINAYNTGIERARDSAVEVMELEDLIRRQSRPLEEQDRTRVTYLVETDEPQWTGWE